MIKHSLIAALAALIALFAVPAIAMDEDAKIDALVKAVADSHATFIRNGQHYSAYQASQYLAYRHKTAGSRIENAEQFITQLGSKSSVSGEPYMVKTQAGRLIPAESWLRRELNEIITADKKNTTLVASLADH